MGRVSEQGRAGQQARQIDFDKVAAQRQNVENLMLQNNKYVMQKTTRDAHRSLTSWQIPWGQPTRSCTLYSATPSRLELNSSVTWCAAATLTRSWKGDGPDSELT